MSNIIKFKSKSDIAVEFLEMVIEEIKEGKLDNVLIACKDKANKNVLTGYCNLDEGEKHELIGHLQVDTIRDMINRNFIDQWEENNMKIKNVKLKWNVLCHDTNSDDIINYNIFWDGSSKEIADRIKKNKITNYNDFKNSMKSMFMHDFWSRTEYEILVSGLFTKAGNIKIDVWRQIEMNFDRVLEYIIKEMDINFKGEK